VQPKENFGRLPNVELWHSNVGHGHIATSTWWNNSDVDVEGEDFFYFFFIFSLFPTCSHQVPKMFPKFPMCSPRVFPIAPRFNPICFAQSPPLLTCIPWGWGHKWT
jgi:hypothetical protein